MKFKLNILLIITGFTLLNCSASTNAEEAILEPRAHDLVGRHHGAHALPRALPEHPAALVHVAVQRDEAAMAVPLVGRPLALVRVAVGAHLPAVAIARVVCPVALVPGEGMLRASRVCAISR